MFNLWGLGWGLGVWGGVCRNSFSICSLVSPLRRLLCFSCVSHVSPLLLLCVVLVSLLFLLCFSCVVLGIPCFSSAYLVYMLLILCFSCLFLFVFCFSSASLVYVLVLLCFASASPVLLLCFSHASLAKQKKNYVSLRLLVVPRGGLFSPYCIVFYSCSLCCQLVSFLLFLFPALGPQLLCLFPWRFFGVVCCCPCPLLLSASPVFLLRFSCVSPASPLLILCFSGVSSASPLLFLCCYCVLSASPQFLLCLFCLSSAYLVVVLLYVLLLLSSCCVCPAVVLLCLSSASPHLLLCLPFSREQKGCALPWCSTPQKATPG